MSHFTVAVFSHKPEEVETLLAPYEEEPENPEYIKFTPSSKPKSYWLEMYEKNKDNYETFADYLECEEGFVVNEDGEVGSLGNPNAKWDWWMVGGRWPGILKLKPGCDGGRGRPSLIMGDVKYKENTCDQARVCDVDFSMDQKAYDRAIRFWEVVVDGQPIREDERKADFFTVYTTKYYIEQFGTKENYAKDKASFRTWAFITPDGKWAENGTMGWFGISDSTIDSRKTYAEALEEMIENGQELWITIVDCHI